MRLKPIEKRERVYQAVIQQIKQAIEQGEILPGEKLPSERTLAETLGVSRTSIKEAMTVLESTGVIDVRPGVGMFVREESERSLLLKFSLILDEKEEKLDDLIELRQAIEGDAAFYAAIRITEEQKMKLTAIYEKLVEKEKRAEVATEEDFQFHYTIVEAANNPLMLEVMNLVSDKMMDSVTEIRNFSIQHDQLNEQVVKEHEKIYEAIIHHQPEEARKAMWEHHQGIKVRLLKKGGKEQ